MQRISTVCRLAATGLLVATLGGAPLRAQSELENIIEQFGGTSVKGYIQPLADLLGANMNAGFNRAAVPHSGLHISLELVAMAARVSDNQKTYTASTPAGFTPGTFTTATVFGDTGSTVTDLNNPSLTFRGSDGLIKTSTFPSAVPQLRIGAIAGTEAVVRFVSTPSFGDSSKFPSVKVFGFGVRHNVGRYLGVLPVELTASAMYTSFTVGEYIDAKAFTLGAQAGKTFSLLSVWGGLAWEKSTLNLSYTSTDPNLPGSVNIDLKGANKFRFQAGAGLKLVFLRLFGEASVGSVTNFAAGIGFGS